MNQNLSLYHHNLLLTEDEDGSLSGYQPAVDLARFQRLIKEAERESHEWDRREVMSHGTSKPGVTGLHKRAGIYMHFLPSVYHVELLLIESLNCGSVALCSKKPVKHSCWYFWLGIVCHLITAI